MKETITIPDGWNEVTLGQFQELMSIDKEHKDYPLEVISILIDKDPEEIRKYDPVSANKIMRHLEWAMKTPDESEYKQELEIEGVTYRLVENLNRFSGGEWWDMEDYLQDHAKNMHSLFSLLYRPVVVDYTFDMRNKTANILQDKAMIGDLYGAMVFFSLVGKKSILTIQDYLIQQVNMEMKGMSRKQKRTLLMNVKL